MASTMNHANTKAEVIEAFRVFDRDGHGVIRADDLRQILRDLGDVMDDGEIEEMIYEADTASNGQIQYEPFVEMLFMWDNPMG
mmetsp:Transcript_49288/g.123930  ORF Transcript_49288/g.123930 Transcript_49288/m.123930 type:complete len:83 (+) Transcript_49288:90-338(+)|eukprot:CAMPEP_0177651738 /NCGR_PEP_ID=MMETSP0447-20121125/12721_1 /TAXON_ID=0 /ORGANISM="Stygamoeba regulata, Strain BSH-02190019" /LENGTH=82 /DNA_ID=CAMNT_0019154865 /DNA_START=17 /DNA_END=265 /DNA_ORIENTATION=-